MVLHMPVSTLARFNPAAPEFSPSQPDCLALLMLCALTKPCNRKTCGMLLATLPYLQDHVREQ